MPLVDIQLIKGVFTPDQKKQMIQKVTDAMVAVEGEADATCHLGARAGNRKWGLGNRRQSADHRRCQGDSHQDLKPLNLLENQFHPDDDASTRYPGGSGTPFSVP